MDMVRDKANHKRILLIANTARFLVLFEENDMKILKEMGYEIHCASNFAGEQDETDARSILERRGAVTHQIDIARSPLSYDNLHAYRQLASIMKKYDYQAVHCHTPMGAVLARIAARRFGVAPVIYTVHGLHFYKGAPLKNWLIYYPIESFLSGWTDLIITINREDYGRAKRLHAKHVAYIPGVGIDTARYGQFRAPDEVDEGRKRAGKIRKELQIPEDALVLLTVGDLIVRKNQKTVIEALSKTGRNDLYYVLCGQGPLKEEYEKMAERLGVGGQIRFAGYRKDVGDFYTMADVFVFPSYQEGLSVAVMEAMANGLPMVLSGIRGNVDLVRDGEGGFLCGPDDAEAFAGRIELLAEQPELRRKMGEKNLREIKKYDLSEADRRMRRIYRKMLGGAV